MLYTNFLERKFRRGSSYSLCEWKNLHSAGRELLAGLYDSNEVYGVFQPNLTLPHLTTKIAYREMALLYLHLQQPGFLPHCFIRSSERQMQESVAQLLFDGVLELEQNDYYISGSEAVQAVCGISTREQTFSPDYITQLSLKAIAYGYSLHGLNATQMATKLYCFHNLPVKDSLLTFLTDHHSVLQFLLNGMDKKEKTDFENAWYSIQPGKTFAWLSWQKRRPNKSVSLTHDAIYKLYISPTPEELPAVFQKAIPILTSSECFCFKTGASVKGLLRPDKMVAYFSNKESLIKATEVLKKNLFGTTAHGVPFTAQLDAEGLFSWGVDPPRNTVLNEVEGGSWRSTVTEQVAIAILSAQTRIPTWQEAVPFIWARLQTTGIDPYNWTMQETM